MPNRQSVRTVVAAALLVALAAAASIYGLNRWATRSAATQLLLVELTGELHALSALEWEAIAQREVEPELERQLGRSRAHIAALKREVEAGVAADDLRAFAELYAHYDRAVDHAFDLIKAGDIDAALEFDALRVDPLFDRLSDAIGELAATRSADKRRIALLADLGMALSLLAAASVVGALFSRFTAARAAQARRLQQALDDLQQAQDRLVQSEKLAALGQLIASIAHEVNTPLGAIRAAAGNGQKALQAVLAQLPRLAERLDGAGQAAFFGLIEQARASRELVTASERRPVMRALAQQLQAAGIDDARSLADLLVDIGVRDRIEPALALLRHAERDWLLALAYDLSRLQGNTDTILAAVERATKVVFALKSYARVEQGVHKAPVDLREGLDTVLDLYKTQIRQGVDVERDYRAAAPVDGHADELLQVWTNLVHNAVQAMDGKGTLRLATAQRDGHVVVSVTDSGPGIPAAVRPRLFEPFFTTKPRGEGSGLGLHICQQIVARHDGRIEVASEPGRTTFSVWLPAASTQAASAQATAHTDPAPVTTGPVAA